MKEKLLKGLKFLGKAGYQVLRIAAGGYTVTTGVVTFNPIVAWNGVEAISNVISASTKDNKGGKVRRSIMALVNLLANNVGMAKNDTRINK